MPSTARIVQQGHPQLGSMNIVSGIFMAKILPHHALNMGHDNHDPKFCLSPSGFPFPSHILESGGGFPGIFFMPETLRSSP